MRAVLDTNIFISGIHWAGSPREVLWAWYSGKFELVTSPAILDELSETLSTFRIIISQERLERWRNAITGKSIIVTPTNLIRAVQDPDDNKFIEAAVEGNADFIVSKDKHLLELKKYDKIEILTPEEFLEKIC
ncbi:MAG: putative toxin-antitoxin system toxin component, PIN family [Candidatus Woesearchaeota archaeon]